MQPHHLLYFPEQPFRIFRDAKRTSPAPVAATRWPAQTAARHNRPLCQECPQSIWGSRGGIACIDTGSSSCTASNTKPFESEPSINAACPVFRGNSRPRQAAAGQMFGQVASRTNDSIRSTETAGKRHHQAILSYNPDIAYRIPHSSSWSKFICEPRFVPISTGLVPGSYRNRLSHCLQAYSLSELEGSKISGSLQDGH